MEHNDICLFQVGTKKGSGSFVGERPGPPRRILPRPSVPHMNAAITLSQLGHSENDKDEHGQLINKDNRNKKSDKETRNRKRGTTHQKQKTTDALNQSIGQDSDASNNQNEGIANKRPRTDVLKLKTCERSMLTSPRAFTPLVSTQTSPLYGGPASQADAGKAQ